VQDGTLYVGDVVLSGPGYGRIRSLHDDNGKLIAMDTKLNDKVLYAKYAGTEIKINGKKLLILKESDILAIVE
jgi:chaperonin GroES